MKSIKQTVYLPVKVEDDATFLITKEISNYLNYNCSINFYEDGRCVYTPCFITQTTKESEELEHLIIERLDRKKAFVFTSEQLNEYTKNIIKQTLEIAAERAYALVKDHDLYIREYVGTEYSVDIDMSEGSPLQYGCSVITDKQSITNTFEETFKKFFVSL